MLRDRWVEVLEAVKHERKVAWILLEKATVESLSDGALTLNFTNEGYAKGFGSSGYDADLGRVLKAMFGISPQIRAATGGTGGQSGPVGQSGRGGQGSQGGSGRQGGGGGHSGVGFGSPGAPAGAPSAGSASGGSASGGAASGGAASGGAALGGTASGAAGGSGAAGSGALGASASPGPAAAAAPDRETSRPASAQRPVPKIADEEFIGDYEDYEDYEEEGAPVGRAGGAQAGSVDAPSSMALIERELGGKIIE